MVQPLQCRPQQRSKGRSHTASREFQQRFSASRLHQRHQAGGSRLGSSKPPTAGARGLTCPRPSGFGSRFVSPGRGISTAGTTPRDQSRRGLRSGGLKLAGSLAGHAICADRGRRVRSWPLLFSSLRISHAPWSQSTSSLCCVHEYIACLLLS
jgi:hypothetical protein